MKYPENYKYDLLSSNEVVVYLDNFKNYEWFNGHFPIIPIFPAVGILNLVVFLFKEHFQVDINESLETISQAKFQKSIFEDSSIKITLKLVDQQASYEISDIKDDSLISFGKFKLFNTDIKE
jgi:3-hydroxymyristoyl/3-hydroxydecanoyl-(acyl carrier protein) dehydratase